jgi:hypothetical protein
MMRPRLFRCSEPDAFFLCASKLFSCGPMNTSKKALIERALGAELGHHLGYLNDAVKPEAVSNQRNGTSGKTKILARADLSRDSASVSVGPEALGF